MQIWCYNELYSWLHFRKPAKLIKVKPLRGSIMNTLVWLSKRIYLKLLFSLICILLFFVTLHLPFMEGLYCMKVVG